MGNMIWHLEVWSAHDASVRHYQIPDSEVPITIEARSDGVQALFDAVDKWRVAKVRPRTGSAIFAMVFVFIGFQF